jgi:hypothetical protein
MIRDHRRQTADGVCVPNNRLDKLIGFEVKEFYLTVLSSSNHHIVDAVHFYFIYL